jgi:hypothetical protein
LGFTTNQRSIPVGYLLHLLIQGHHGPVLSGFFIAEEAHGVGDNGLENTGMLMYRNSWRPFRTCPGDLTVSLTKLFSGKKQTSNLGTTLLNFWIIRVSRLFDVGLKKMHCIKLYTLFHSC